MKTRAHSIHTVARLAIRLCYGIMFLMLEKDRKFEDKSLRNKAAASIQKARTWERTGNPYNINRSGWEYMQGLGGVAHLFSYIKTLPSKTVLDVGAGTTHGAHQLSRTSFAQGLHFEATILRDRPEIQHYLGSKNIHVTSVETLRGIPDSSVGCVIAVQSLRYSGAPALAVQSIDRVLVPGGVLKASSLIDAFAIVRDSLVKLGYDVAFEKKFPETRALLGIKPGGPLGPSAAELLNDDVREADEQIRKALSE